VNKRADDQFSPDETQQRFEKLVKSALNTPPKPLKSMTPKGIPAQSKKRLAVIERQRQAVPRSSKQGKKR
jgi:hypothetical protein